MSDIHTAADEAIAAADDTYGPSWRTWATSVTAGPGARKLSAALLELERQACDHNCIPATRWLRSGWVCVRCDRWFRQHPPRRPQAAPDG